MYLFDSNIISELFRAKSNAGVIALSQRVSQTYISTITLDEVIFGLSAKPKPRILEQFEIFVATQCILLPVIADIAKRSGELRGRLRTKGINRSQADLLIAATALQHSLTLVTRNVKDFELCDVQILNPFKE